jgi:hypothetical protein
MCELALNYGRVCAALTSEKPGLLIFLVYVWSGLTLRLHVKELPLVGKLTHFVDYYITW